MDLLLVIHKDAIKDSVFQNLRSLVEAFEFRTIRRESKAAADLSEWIKSIYMHAKIFGTIKVKKRLSKETDDLVMTPMR